jgi:hypothetical protein
MPYNYQLGFKTREITNSDLSACLTMVGIHVLIIPYNILILSLRGPSLGKSETL